MTTDTSEKGLESLIVRSLIDESGYAAGDPKDFDRDHAVDVVKLFAFLSATQPKAVEALGIGDGCQRRSKSTPLAGVKMHHLMRFSPALAVVPVVHRRDPRCFV